MPAIAIKYAGRPTHSTAKEVSFHRMLTINASTQKAYFCPKTGCKKRGTVMAGGHGNDFQVTGLSSALGAGPRLLWRCCLEAAAMVILWQVLLSALVSVAVGATVYDQRQTGKTNVRVEVRDALIVAIGDGEFGGDYDYSYDYSDLTIKPSQSTPSTRPTPTTSSYETPSKSTTSKATTTSTTAAAGFNITQNAAVVLEAENNSIIFPASVKPGGASGEPIKITPSNGGYRPDQVPVLVIQERPDKFLPVKTVEKEDASSGEGHNVGVISPKRLPTRHCAPGFSLDEQNRCKRIRRPTRERPQLP